MRTWTVAILSLLAAALAAWILVAWLINGIHENREEGTLDGSASAPPRGANSEPALRSTSTEAREGPTAPAYSTLSTHPTPNTDASKGDADSPWIAARVRVRVHGGTRGKKRRVVGRLFEIPATERALIDDEPHGIYMSWCGEHDIEMTLPKAGWWHIGISKSTGGDLAEGVRVSESAATTVDLHLPETGEIRIEL